MGFLRRIERAHGITRRARIVEDLHGPNGLNIGAKTPEEISILALTFNISIRELRSLDRDSLSGFLNPFKSLYCS